MKKGAIHMPWKEHTSEKMCCFIFNLFIVGPGQREPGLPLEQPLPEERPLAGKSLGRHFPKSLFHLNYFWYITLFI
jgi:hypothetical protein